MSRFKVLITNPSVPKKAFELLHHHCDVIYSENASRPAILAKVGGVDAIFWSTKETLDAEVLDRAGPQMKTVGVMSAGIDNIDVAELKRRGIKAGNTPYVLDGAVADVAVLLALAASRRFHEGRLLIDNNKWLPGVQTQVMGQDIAGSTVGIVGLGGMGQAIVRRLQGFQVAKFLYTGHREKDEGKKLGAQFVNLDQLVKESDFVILSCPLTSETTNLFNDDIFNKMKNTAVLVNMARGQVVDQDALIRALKEGKIFAAGLDVMTPEPLPSDNELAKLPNAVLSPHIGSATIKTREAMAELASQNILMGLGGEEMFTPIC